MVRRPRTDQLRLRPMHPACRPGVLTLRAEAADEEHLHRLEQRVADRLEQIGRRGRLTVTWTPPWGAGEQPPKRPIGATEANERTRT